MCIAGDTHSVGRMNTEDWLYWLTAYCEREERDYDEYESEEDDDE
jgi:hypothetical protein